jgi:hypothetical protein
MILQNHMERFQKKIVKRIRNLKQEDCCDKESFQYKNKSIWNGF